MIATRVVGARLNAACTVHTAGFSTHLAPYPSSASRLLFRANAPISSLEKIADLCRLQKLPVSWGPTHSPNSRGGPLSEPDLVTWVMAQLGVVGCTEPTAGKRLIDMRDKTNDQLGKRGKSMQPEGRLCGDPNEHQVTSAIPRRPSHSFSW